MRQTVKIRDLIERVNSRNRNSTCEADCRWGWNSLLEEVLMANNTYAGFRYLEKREVPAGFDPGLSDVGDRRRFPDPSRVEYLVHSKLKTAKGA